MLNNRVLVILLFLISALNGAHLLPVWAAKKQKVSISETAVGYTESIESKRVVFEPVVSQQQIAYGFYLGFFTVQEQSNSDISQEGRKIMQQVCSSPEIPSAASLYLHP